MRYLALATDFDGTLATDGAVDDMTLAALDRLRGSGRKLILVTGRELDELRRIFPALGRFDRVVAENGGLLYRPASQEEKPLGPPAPERLVAALRSRGVTPISVGRVIVATWQPHESTVREVIGELGLEYQMILNKGAVMLLPVGINKASGLAAALEELGLSASDVVGVGDAENDLAFLQACHRGVAVANATELLKHRADWVTAADHGAGVRELIDRLLSDDLAWLEACGRLKNRY
ncbi:MAG TPA: HAD family hydrolase [Pirellulales bacterium]